MTPRLPQVGIASVPRFRAVNEEVLRFDLGMALEDTVGGVFVDEAGCVRALWAAYSNCSLEEELFEQFEGMPIEVARPAVAQFVGRCAEEAQQRAEADAQLTLELVPTDNGAGLQIGFAPGPQAPQPAGAAAGLSHCRRPGTSPGQRRAPWKAGAQAPPVPRSATDRGRRVPLKAG